MPVTPGPPVTDYHRAGEAQSVDRRGARGTAGEQVLAAVGRSLNVVLVRPEPAASGAGADDAGGEAEAAAGALRRAAGVSAAYVLVAADPLAAVAEAWQAMWALTGEAHGSDEFELRAAEAMGAWRAKRFELPDYYLVLAAESGPGGPGGARGAGVSGAPGAFGALGSSGGPGAPVGPARARHARTSTWGPCARSGRTGSWWPRAPPPPRRRTRC